MKKMYKSFTMLLTLSLFLFGSALAQQPTINNYRPNNLDGLNMFETKKDPAAKFDGLKVRVGGDFAIQFQGLRQTNSGDSLVELVSNLNLPTANLSIDVQLYDGVRLHMMTYLSARHHTEAWVKGGYIQFDKLDFIREGFLEGLMDYAYIRVGLDEINYGDAHFRRTDNARAFFNPFVGNYLMDAFTTEAFGEVVVQTETGLIGVIGVSNGMLNQNVTVTNRYNGDNKVSFYGKVGIDRELSPDVRVRLTGSWYTNQGTTTGTYLYGGDRAGSRYYNVMHDPQSGGSDFTGRLNPSFKQNTSFQINPFVKIKGFEFFGIYENASNGSDIESQANGSFTQIAAEALYRFGSQEQLYIAGRYNSVSGEMNDDVDTETQTINRVNIGAGWYVTRNILTKIEYVNQQYEGDGWNGSLYQGGEFKGVVIEAAVSF
jgi:hypothetical protein